MAGTLKPRLKSDPFLKTWRLSTFLFGERGHEVSRLLMGIGDGKKEHPGLVLRMELHGRRGDYQARGPLSLYQLRLESLGGLLDHLVAQLSFREQ